jgi:prepilin-type N-terminal cleavage/methylation domain-containing protein
MTATNHIINKGFTLLETLASIAILSVVIIGPLSAIISSSGYAKLTKDTIVATYLAEESIELLQNQYDSLYVYCEKNASSTELGGLCVPTDTATTTGQTSWRLFKDRLAGVNGQPTCYIPKNNNGGGSYPDNASAGNSKGCSFDYLNMTASSTQDIVRFTGDDSRCAALIPVATSTIRHTSSQSVTAQEVVSTSTSYVCSSDIAKIGGLPNLTKTYTRTVTVDQLPTFESALLPNLQYNDDLRIVATVDFKGINGVSHSIKVIRFMHARP